MHGKMYPTQYTFGLLVKTARGPPTQLRQLEALHTSYILVHLASCNPLNPQVEFLSKPGFSNKVAVFLRLLRQVLLRDAAI